ncbi:AlkA N-terminal domain-containing protein [Streptomyces sp. NPDC005438]|uniref:AlkA N-terminal domain-containing protein n=1 Tax=Streptomyces sp. NPDC005438 TaxID=3156880 RepID=UPI0033A2B745
MRSRDARFDGRFYVGVTSTGIYCRPSCPAMTPRRENVRFYPSAAAAQTSGFRACKRCRPDATPGSPEWNIRADVVGRAVRLIADGVMDRGGVATLADELGYSARQLHRLVTAEMGAGPLALARAQRAQTARTLIESTRMSMTEIGLAAGFSSVRQFNDTMRQVFDRTPSHLREAARRRPEASAPGAITLRLPYRPPMDLDRVLGFLALRAVPGVEEYVAGEYRRVLSLPHATGTVALSADEGRHHLRCRLHLEDLRDLQAAVRRCRQLLDLDADPEAVSEALGACPTMAPLVAASPGTRSPGHVDPTELAFRALIGQQVSVAAARTLAGRLAARHGKPLTAPDGGLTHAFPTPQALAEVDPGELPMPRARGRALRALAESLASGRLDLGPGADREEAEARLLELPGIGPWTASYVRMRALGDPDVFLPTDLGVRHALEGLGHPGTPAEARRMSARWRPWRSYALHHLWATLAPAGPQAARSAPSTTEDTK